MRAECLTCIAVVRNFLRRPHSDSAQDYDQTAQPRAICGNLPPLLPAATDSIQPIGRRLYFP